jgi:TRAP-type mannitol/chloroaromatic compound transport system permease large subunit
VLLSVFFAGISGSSTADAASQGKIFIEAQVKEGYDLSFSIAITAVSAVLAVIIPPSILMVVWGGVLSVSIGALYLAGVIPGLLIGLAQMATVHVYAKIRHYPTYRRATFKEFVTARGHLDPGADDAVHHRRRHSARLVHATSRGGGRNLRGSAVDFLLPRDGREEAVGRPARNGKLSRSRCFASARRRFSVGPRLLPDP